MLARFVECEQCGLRAIVRVATNGRKEARRSEGKRETQVVDCPSCGIHEQPAQIATSELAADRTPMPTFTAPLPH
jgi:DNA-directed RNA polymerase subunit RPC12/RpoP